MFLCSILLVYSSLVISGALCNLQSAICNLAPPLSGYVLSATNYDYERSDQLIDSRVRYGDGGHAAMRVKSPNFGVEPRRRFTCSWTTDGR